MSDIFGIERKTVVWDKPNLQIIGGNSTDNTKVIVGDQVLKGITSMSLEFDPELPTVVTAILKVIVDKLAYNYELIDEPPTPTQVTAGDKYEEIKQFTKDWHEANKLSSKPETDNPDGT